MSPFFKTVSMLFSSFILTISITIAAIGILYLVSSLCKILDLEAGITKAAWNYFQLASIVTIYYFSKFLVSRNLIKNEEKLSKKIKITYHSLGIIFSFIASIILAKVSVEREGFDFTKAVYCSAIILPPFMLGIYYAFVSHFKLTPQEKSKLKSEYDRPSTSFIAKGNRRNP